MSPNTPDAVDRILEQWHRERPDPDASPNGVFGRIARVYARAQHQLRLLLATTGSTPAKFVVLASLLRSGALHRKRLARSRRGPCSAPEARRSAFTSEGLARIDVGVGGHFTTGAAMLEALSDGQVKQTLDMLRARERSVIELPGAALTVTRQRSSCHGR